MNSRRLILIALVAMATSFVRPAAESAQEKESRWFEGQSPHFLVFTDTSETKARRLLEDFEGRFAALESVVGPLPKRQFPIEIFLFDKGDDFTEAAGPEPEESAYLFHGPDRIFIAARDKSPEDVANDAGHAMGHVLFERITLWRPYWITEGAAELFRKAGRKPDLKTISKAEGFSASELLRIVPKAGYRDSDPPVASRTQSHRLLRVIAEKHPEALRAVFRTIRTESGQNARPDVESSQLAKELESYTETTIPLTPRVEGIRTGPSEPLRVAIHRGDLLTAAARPDPAEKRYESVSGSPEARAARAIFVRVSRNPAEASRVLDRAARELPDNPLVQFHFGSIEITGPREMLDAQSGALQNAVQGLPLLGRAHAELARLSTLTGRPELAIPLIEKAVALEPEYANRFFEVRAQALAVLQRFDEARAALKLAAALPHSAERNEVLYDQRIKAMETRVEGLRREMEAKQVGQIRAAVDRAAELAELNDPPPRSTAAQTRPAPHSSMEYTVETNSAATVLNAVYPDFPKVLIEGRKSAEIVFDILVGTDGRVARIAAVQSDTPFLNTVTTLALSRWTFAGHTAPFSAKLTFRYVVEEVER